ncbi:MAG: hypothetical protein L3J37_01065 [Rhodobacteraceae bacterium]|nr:hypothetical protein [Paracoccaceae bacterium]
MHNKYTLILVASLFASEAVADARFDTTQPAPRLVSPLYVQYVQNTPAIEGTALRRMTFYTDRAMASLMQVIEGAADRDLIAQNEVNMIFRASVARLVDAGERSNLTITEVTDIFTAAISERFGPDFIQRVDAAANGLDFYTLFRSVSVTPDPRASYMDQGMQFLNALANAATAEEQSQPPPPDSTTLETVLLSTTTPIALPGANAEERAIIDRVVVNGNQWKITVIGGDSLASIASAVYGDSFLFNVIFQANSDILINASTLNIGDVLILPQP